MISCDRCPGAYHSTCLEADFEEMGKEKVEQLLKQDEPFICDRCRRGVRPMYRDVVWAKCGVYRYEATAPEKKIFGFKHC